MQHHQCADYETSKMLKEIEFSEDCICWFDDKKEIMFSFTSKDESQYVHAPLWYQVEEWLWEKHKITIEIEKVDVSSILFKVRIYQHLKDESVLIFC